MKTGGCLKCGGDTFVDSDIYEVYDECLQCGAVSNIKTVKRYQNLPAARAEDGIKTARRIAREARDKEIYRLANGGTDFKELVKRYGLHRITIVNICKQEKLKEQSHG